MIQPTSKNRKGWRVLACNVVIVAFLVIAASHIHVVKLGDFQVTLFRFANMNGLESDRILLKQEIRSVYAGKELNIDIDYKGRTLTGRLDFYFIIIEQGEKLIKCVGIDDMNTSDRPYVLWDTVIELQGSNLN